MADISLIKPKYKSLFKKLLPKGRLWAAEPGSLFDSLLEGLAIEPARVEGRGIDFLNEMDPRTTFEMLDNWERLLRIPDECTPPGDVSLYQRRVRILQKLTTGGGQSLSFFKLIAKQLGYDVSVIDTVEYHPFRAGISRAGDALNNGNAENENGWAYTFSILGTASLIRRFRAGQSTAGDRLVLIENQTLECVIGRFAPAHATVLFAYET